MFTGTRDLQAALVCLHQLYTYLPVGLKVSFFHTAFDMEAHKPANGMAL